MDTATVLAILAAAVAMPYLLADARRDELRRFAEPARPATNPASEIDMPRPTPADNVVLFPTHRLSAEQLQHGQFVPAPEREALADFAAAVERIADDAERRAWHTVLYVVATAALAAASVAVYLLAPCQTHCG